MELGGNAPAIIMPDCDLDKTTKWIASRKITNAGQGCANINRIFVHESLHEVFMEKLVSEVKNIKVGWGKDMPNAMGALINAKVRDRMLALVEEAVKGGAKLVYGGVIPDNLPAELKEGAFMVPAVLDGVTDDMPIAGEEIFGPIYTVFTFSDLDEVIKRANDTDYGLNSYVFTHDARVISKCAEDLEFGEVYVNFPGSGPANPNMPHVGLKNSGVGCDRSKWALDEYYNFRHIAIQP
jgi:succinate-semialdehyde dehydrogenase/glutarate-semialdehyde dehydrogenase